MHTYTTFSLILSAVLSLAACAVTTSDHGSDVPMCVPGIQVACPCLNEEVGYQVCAADGASFDDCRMCAPMHNAPPMPSGCSADAECGASSPCEYFRCDEQRECIVYHVPAGTKIADVEEPGNCLRWSCDGAGTEVRVYDPTDAPDGGTCGN